jgi:hypothetical protein
MRAPCFSIQGSGSAPPRITQATSISQPMPGAAARMCSCGVEPSASALNSKSWLCQAKP